MVGILVRDPGNMLRLLYHEAGILQNSADECSFCRAFFHLSAGKFPESTPDIIRLTLLDIDFLVISDYPGDLMDGNGAFAAPSTGRSATFPHESRTGSNDWTLSAEGFFWRADQPP